MTPAMAAGITDHIWSVRELIEERWPKLHKILMNPATRILLLLVAIGLFVEVLREHRQETIPKTPGDSPSTDSGTGAKKVRTEGDCSPVTDGKGNTVTATCGDSTQKVPAKKQK